VWVLFKIFCKNKFLEENFLVEKERTIMSLLALEVALLLFSVVLHEYAHGWVAEKCGDTTARDAGRLTLNPLAHLDFIGSIMFPFLLVMLRFPIVFGWAKPVPINPYNFRNYRTDMVKVSLAGVTANFVLAAILAAIIWIIPARSDFTHLTFQWLNSGIRLNLFLATFNLLPIPPLDGSRVIISLLPPSVSHKFESMITPYGFIIIVILLYMGVIERIILPVVNYIQTFLLRGI
jgi:Zn-dependent protease